MEKKTIYIMASGKVVLTEPTPIDGVCEEYTTLQVESLPEMEEKPLYDSIRYYIDGQFTQRYELNVNKANAAITASQNYLCDTDHRIFKSYEAKSRGTDVPFDIQELIKKREEERENIRIIRYLINKQTK